MSTGDEKLWFAMRATYRSGLDIKKRLDEKNIENFIPMQYQEVQKNNKKLKVLVPVISNLIFVHASVSELQQVKQHLPHLQYMVDSRSHKKITISEKDMKRFIAVSGTVDERLRYFDPVEVDWKKGCRVRICGGVFEGLEGVFIKVKGIRDRRVVVAIQGVVAVAMAAIEPDFLEVLPNVEKEKKK